MKSFYNQYLRVNLTDKTYCTEHLPDTVLKETLGGKGLGTHLLLDLLPPDTDPLSPKNILIFTTGPAGGTDISAASRYGVFTKSPLTGIYCESYSGGHVAPVMKRTGYDAIVLEGASADPVYLHISEDGVSFHDAAHLWGKDAYATEDAINAEVAVKGVQSVVIGPGGENLVSFACISNNYWRCAGRGGVGAVLGSKKVKGIAFSGDARAEAADPVLLEHFITDLKARRSE